MPNKKFLIIEFTAHFRNAQDNFYFFSKLFDCFFLINDSNKNKIKLNSKKK